MESKKDIERNNKPYYLAQFNEQGVIDHSDATKQFIIERDSEVRFILRRGTKVSKQAILLVNKPIQVDVDQLEFTVTQPKIPIDLDLPEDEMRHIDYRGSKLNYEYLEEVKPQNGDHGFNLEFRVHFPRAGSFFVQIEYFDEKLQCKNYTQPTYINVEPVLILRDDKMQCKQMSIITVLSRCLGQIERWEEVLSNISQLSYNAVHFTPIQKYGASYSHYSLADQTLIDDYYFGKEANTFSRKQRLSILKEKIDYYRQEYGLLGVIDIVLNHTASNSEWLLDHPESAYNTDDCPHLYSAWLFDKALSDFSDEFAQRKIQECPSAPFVNNEADLTYVINAIQNRVVNKLNLHEFFMCDVDQTLNEVRQWIKTQAKKDLIDEQKQRIDKNKWWTKDHYTLLKDKFTINHGGPSRNNVKLNLPICGVYFYLANNQNEEKCIQELRVLLQKHNEDWKIKIKGFMGEALDAIRGTLRYFKLELKDNKITLEKQLLRRYFTELENEKQSKVAHNGWIMNANPLSDFAMEGWHYLRRSINIWSDSVKLRYGKCPADSPYLWEHMSTYVIDMATIFDGFRLDNAHSTPIHACYYLLQIARAHNPNLFVMAELFTSSAELDALFVQQLNLNGLVRELQNTYDTKQLGDYFHQLTCREAVIGLIDQEFEDIKGHQYKILKARKPIEIIYDCTHDNPAPVEKFKTGRIALPFIGVCSMADQAIATTWGVDILLPNHLNVVTEKRLYQTFNQDNLFTPDNQDPQQRRKKQQNSQHKEPQINGHLEEEKHEEVKKTDFEYEFVFYSEQASKLQVTGEFSNWNQRYDLKKSGHNKWSNIITLPIREGKDKYEYKFIINDNNWQINTNLPQIKDQKGNVNNYVEIPGSKQQSQLHQSFTSQYVSNTNEYQFSDMRYARRRLNEIHEECTNHNAEIFLHQQSAECLVIIRQFQLDYSDEFDGYVSITRHCYFMEGGDYNYQTSIELPGYLTEVVFAGYLEFDQHSAYSQVNDKDLIKGANARFKVYKDLGKFCRKEKVQGQDKERLSFFMMPPGFTCVVKTKHPSYMKDSIRYLNSLNKLSTKELCTRLFNQDTALSAFNHLLFRCNDEERDISNGERGPYGLQKSGQFVYAGITSIMHILRQLKLSGDMGHELFSNMREGDWLIDYTTKRLSFMEDDLRNTIKFLNDYFYHVKRLYPTFKPKYGCRVIEKLYNAAVQEIICERMTDKFVNYSDDIFIQRMALAVIQMWGRVPSAEFYNHKDSMCAGLTHFSTGYMRCWGRDTFIALRGLFIATGLENEAKETIRYFARIVRHGLIPNLHDRGINTRFNARDATWFFLQVIIQLSYKIFIQAIKDFYLQSSNGEELLKEQVELHFRDNDQRIHWDKVNRQEPPRKIAIADIIQEMLQAHASGIEFREWNAGTNIDSQMKSEGFNVKIWLDKETGFCFGGNQWNCGTWMDKMGSSEKTGNKGIPATPRDGAPIELVAMQYSVLRFMQSLSESEIIKHKGVNVGQDFWTYGQWAELIKNNFERCFYVPLNDQDDHHHIIDRKLVNRRGIYKDVFRSINGYTDYQFRPNLCVAMAYAPDLFDEDHAKICLKNVETILMEQGCMGIKTLDPSDKNYRGDYINSDDSQGWNYHQGPEWLWPVGFFLKSKMIFQVYHYKYEILEDIMKWLIPHQKHIMKDDWEGLPELTNSHGKICHDSCTTQAWSISTIFDALRDLYYL